DNWSSAEVHSVEHQASIDAFANARFELPQETLQAGDEVVAGLAAPAAGEQNEEFQQKQTHEEAEVEKDPFA
ncbi:FCH domain only protein 1, partial [Trifolium medium]|nr:FCH domain only protein 1 [Trifolium medium]